MRIAYICSGTGGAFYCENCMRDHALISGLRALGHDVVIVPMYLPVYDNDAAGGAAPVIFGAVRLYLTDKFPPLKRAPGKLLRALDHRKVLDIAAAFAASTRPAGNEEMTISMLQGEDGPFADEFGKSAMSISSLKPDTVFISNAFLLGIASAVKTKLPVPVVCMLQDEHLWVDSSAPEYREKIWAAVAEKCRRADALVAHSDWFRRKIAASLDIPADGISLAPLGVDPAGYTVSAARAPASSIGYISRLCGDMGMDILADAYCLLLKGGVCGAALEFCGGFTGDDAKIISGCRKKISAAGGRMRVRKGFGMEARAALLSTLSALSVPARNGIAFGGFITEAMASGVPAVQPDTGGFSEIIEETGAGLLYSPNTPEALAEALERVIRDKDLRKSMAEAGRAAVERKYNHIEMARGIMEGT